MNAHRDRILADFELSENAVRHAPDAEEKDARWNDIPAGLEEVTPDEWESWAALSATSAPMFSPGLTRGASSLSLCRPEAAMDRFRKEDETPALSIEQ